jgi:iron complex outermembrane receptor protein
MRTTTRATIVGLAAIAATVSAAADDHVPRSLHMRAPQPTSRRVAQVPPDGPQGAAPDDPRPPPAADPANLPADSSPPADPPSDSTAPAAADPPSPPVESPPPESPPPESPPPESPPPATPASPPAAPRPASPPEPSAEPATPVNDDGKGEVISVTGTSLERQLFTGRAPTSVITRDELNASGRATLGDILQAMPGQSNAGNAQVNAGGDGTTRINLRGLGAPRTLVLLNGRRIVNGGPGADSAVDVNAIPLAVIERVEVLKDGASAIYGADAVGGVVNLVTRTQLDGVEVSLLTSTSQRGDGTEYAGNLSTGFMSSDKRTYFLLSGGYQQHDPVFAGDRALSTFQRSYNFATRTESHTTSLAAPSGRLDVSSLGAGGMQPPGCTTSLCKPVGNGAFADFVEPNDLYNEAEANYVYTPSTRYSVFASAGNRILDSTAVMFEVMYQHRDSSRELSPVAFAADSPISQFSLYNPLGVELSDYRRRMTELGPRQYIDNVGALRFVLGAHGKLPDALGLKDWKYEISENYGITTAVAGTTGQLIKSRVADAIGPSMLDVNGVPTCVRTPGDITTKIEYGGIPCVPLNLLVPAGKIPREQLANLTFTDAGEGSDTQRSLLITMNGRVAELPNHGSISLSVGGDRRSEVGNQQPPLVARVTNTTDNPAFPTDGESDVTEGYGELSIVPISGHDIARLVELDLGARVVRDSRFGTSLTYKAGALLRTVHGIAARGTYATAFRAPSLFDLYGGRTERTAAVEDPCDAKPPSVGDGTRALDPRVQAQCTAQSVPVDSRLNTSLLGAVIGGNRDLKAESAATTSLGVVIEPPQIPGLAISADYWRIAIDNAIETLGVQTIFANCYDRGIQSFCDQIHRDPGSSRVRTVDQFLQNVPRTTTSGIDLALWYDVRLGELGRIHTGLEAQYLVRYDLHTSLQVIHGAGFYDLGVYPRYKANLSSNWVRGGASAGYTLRYVGSYKECAGNDCNNESNLAVASRDVGRYYKLDLFGGYEVKSRAGRTTVQVGVNNLFDAAPPVVYNAPAANSDATTYDFVGRMAYVRLSQQF